MGKGKENPKAEQARARKEDALRAKQDHQEEMEEDAYWKAAGDGEKSKAAAKKAEKEKEREAASAAKAEAKRLAAEEEEEMASYGKKKEKEGKQKKMTQHELMLMQEKQRREQEKLINEQMHARDVSEKEYAAMVDVNNSNRETDTIDASGIDAAVNALKDMEGPGVMDNHPEKRVRGAYKVYERENLSVVMSQYPGLTLSQYKEKLWKSFLKSESNPLNA